MAELLNMSDQFRGLPMDSLIGGPLMAACDAQMKLANATADFIKVIGFEEPPDAAKPEEPGKPRIAQFRFKRPADRPSDTALVPGELPHIDTEDVEIDVPLLAIVKVPNLSITSVDVIFDMEVKSSFTSTEKTKAQAGMSADASIGWGVFKARVHIQGKVSSHKENTRSSDNSAKYHVEVHAVDSGMPEGLARVMDILHSSIAPSWIAPTGLSKDEDKSGTGADRPNPDAGKPANPKSKRGR